MEIFKNFNQIFNDLEELTELAKKIDKQSKLINKNKNVNYE